MGTGVGYAVGALDSIHVSVGYMVGDLLGGRNLFIQDHVSFLAPTPRYPCRRKRRMKAKKREEKKSNEVATKAERGMALRAQVDSPVDLSTCC